MNLLIDMGNSCLKWAILKNKTTVSGSSIFYDDCFKQQLSSLWLEIDNPQSIVISCVKELAWLKIVQDVSIKLWRDAEIKIITPLSEGFGVKSAYQNPEQLGVDRWLALLAARHYFIKTDCCIVDCGTAVTIDLLNNHGQHLGGVIAPGLTLLKNSLVQGTSSLDYFERRHSVGLADNTEAGIYSGTLLSIVGLIEHIMDKNPDFQLILTGGDAEIVAEQLNMNFIIQANMVLQGLAVTINHPQNND